MPISCGPRLSTFKDMVPPIDWLLEQAEIAYGRGDADAGATWREIAGAAVLLLRSGSGPIMSYRRNANAPPHDAAGRRALTSNLPRRKRSEL